MNRLEFSVLWTDYDGMLQLAVRASSLTHAAYHETYLYADQLAEFADGLRDFPRDASSEVVLECGAKDPKWHDYLRLRVFVVKPTGQSALEIESEIRGDPPVCAESHFFISGMPADFNRLGSALAAWVKSPDDWLSVDWRD